MNENTAYADNEMVASFIESNSFYEQNIPDITTPLLHSPEETEIKLNRNNDHNSYYPKFLTLIGLFYILPSLQFVFFQSKEEGIFCYYNYKCFHNLDFIPAFNAIISNALYIIWYNFLIAVKVTDNLKYRCKVFGFEKNALPILLYRNITNI